MQTQGQSVTQFKEQVRANRDVSKGDRAKEVQHSPLVSNLRSRWQKWENALEINPLLCDLSWILMASMSKEAKNTCSQHCRLSHLMRMQLFSSLLDGKSCFVIVSVVEFFVLCFVKE